MKKILASAFLTLLIAVSTRAAVPTAESIDKLLAAQQIEKSVTAMTANLNQMIRQGVQQAVPGEKLTAEDEKLLEGLRVKMTDAISGELKWDKIKVLYEQVYAATFTQDEVDGLTAFYNSPLGQIFASKQPDIALKTQVATQKRLIPVMRELHEAASEVIDQIVAAHQAAQKSPVAPPDAPASPAPKSSP